MTGTKLQARVQKRGNCSQVCKNYI